MYVTEISSWKEFAEQFKGIGNVNNWNIGDIRSMFPTNPVISYYTDEGEWLFDSDSENDFMAFRILIQQNNLKGYYFTVSTEWYDENDVYHGDGNEHIYEKYYFNMDGKGALSDKPHNLFNGPFEMIGQIMQITKENK